jgi:mannose-6-phosphate isomerase-like protein (cupin superfamily)
VAAVIAVTVVSMEDVEPVRLAGGSWSRVLLNSATVGGNHTSLGYSVIRPGTATLDLSHQVEELAYVVSGDGELRMEDGTSPLAPGRAVHIPGGVWHTVVNTGDEDLVMVFAFSSPDYPPTERRDPRA